MQHLMATPFTTIFSCSCPFNASEDITTFYIVLFPLVRHIPKHIVQNSEEVNAQIGKDRNDKFFLHNLPCRNGEYLADFSLEKRFAWQKKKKQKKKTNSKKERESYRLTPTQ